MVDDHIVEETTGHDEIGLWGFYLKLFNEDEKVIGREGFSEFPYLLILVKIFPGYWKTQLNRTNQKVDEDNGK